jgi:4-amino-4-deoxychorismate lyase
MSAESPICVRHSSKIGLIETLRFEPDLGCIRTYRHIERMACSAQYFKKSFDSYQALHLLNTINSPTPLRVRLFLDATDQLHLTTHEFTPLDENAVWKVTIAKTKLNSNNPILAHKTDQRSVYEQARAESSLDDVLLTNQHNHVCEGSITSLFVEKNGTLITPPLSDGLLRGVLRQELLEMGQAVEGVIETTDLKRHKFFVGNSLRGLITAILQ